MKYLKSSGQTVLIVQDLGMIKIRMSNVSGGAICNRADVGGKRLRIALLDTLIALPQSFCNSTR